MVIREGSLSRARTVVELEAFKASANVLPASSTLPSHPFAAHCEQPWKTCREKHGQELIVATVDHMAPARPPTSSATSSSLLTRAARQTLIPTELVHQKRHMTHSA